MDLRCTLQILVFLDSSVILIINEGVGAFSHSNILQRRQPRSLESDFVSLQSLSLIVEKGFRVKGSQVANIQRRRRGRSSKTRCNYYYNTSG